MSKNAFRTADGFDAFIETDCDSRGDCVSGSGTEPHLMVFAEARCGQDGLASPWFDVTTGLCRDERAPDSDSDGLANNRDNCPAWPNADQRDTNGDGIGDVCQCGDADEDGDIDAHDPAQMADCIGAGTCDTTLLDLNGKGAVTAQDISVLSQVSEGRRPAWRLGCARRPGGLTP